MDHEALTELAAVLEIRQENAVISAAIDRDIVAVQVTANTIAHFLQFLRTDINCQFTTLIDVTAVDYPQREKRFDVVYHLLSMKENQRIRVTLSVREGEIVPSVSDVFPSANWLEREVFDMYGISFSGHPDLRRLLTDYGFEGHPLRKDFPTTGYKEVRYDEVEKRVIYEPVTLTQDYRQFDFMSPWEGAEYILPDEGETDA